MGRVFGGELSETQDISGLASHMLSLKYGNVKDACAKPHQSATPTHLTQHRKAKALLTKHDSTTSIRLILYSIILLTFNNIIGCTNISTNNVILVKITLLLLLIYLNCVIGYN